MTEEKCEACLNGTPIPKRAIDGHHALIARLRAESTEDEVTIAKLTLERDDAHRARLAAERKVMEAKQSLRWADRYIRSHASTTAKRHGLKGGRAAGSWAAFQLLLTSIDTASTAPPSPP